MPDASDGALRELLSGMAKRGLLLRLGKGLYYIIPYEQDPASFIPDWHLLAEHLVKKGEHYIGYYSALQIHGLITQPSLKEQIVVARQIRPSTMTIKGIVFQFIYHNDRHFFGAQKTWVDSFHQVRCSDPEKTLVDCLYKPDYAGGIVEIARALYNVIDKLDDKKLLGYIERFNSQAVIKRLGFLLEVLGLESKIIDRLQKLKTASYVLLDTELPKSGKRHSRWGVQQNLDTETIQSAIRT